MGRYSALGMVRSMVMHSARSKVMALAKVGEEFLHLVIQLDLPDLLVSPWGELLGLEHCQKMMAPHLVNHQEHCQKMTAPHSVQMILKVPPTD
jgi:hypothetical protein